MTFVFLPYIDIAFAFSIIVLLLFADMSCFVCILK